MKHKYAKRNKSYRKRRKQNEKPSLFYRLTMCVMAIMMAALLYFINVKQPFITMKNIKEFSIKDITNLLRLETLFPNNIESVSSQVDYHLLKDHYYSNGSNQVTSIQDGIIVSVDEDEITMLSDSGVTIQYQKLTKVNVKADEKVEQGAPLGTMEDSVIIHCYVSDEEITLEEAIQMK